REWRRKARGPGRGRRAADRRRAAAPSSVRFQAAASIHRLTALPTAQNQALSGAPAGDVKPQKSIRNKDGFIREGKQTGNVRRLRRIPDSCTGLEKSGNLSHETGNSAREVF